MQLRTALRRAAARLADAGVVSADSDASSLLEHVLGMSRGEVQHRAVMGPDLTDEELRRFDLLVAERSARVPLQHLTGLAHFRHLSLQVGPGVFIPRPETEVLVDLAVQYLSELRSAAAVVVDLCSGSGAIALAIATEVPESKVHAVELDPAAHAWAQRNVEQIAPSVQLRLEDGARAFEELRGSVDLVTCNPPYIPEGMVPLDPEVAEHDPALALYGGSADGLRIPLLMAQRAAQLLRPGGVLLMEHAEVQRDGMARGLTAQQHWAEVQKLTDLAARPRITRAVRQGPESG